MHHLSFVSESGSLELSRFKYETLFWLVLLGSIGFI